MKKFVLAIILVISCIKMYATTNTNFLISFKDFTNQLQLGLNPSQFNTNIWPITIINGAISGSSNNFVYPQFDTALSMAEKWTSLLQWTSAGVTNIGGYLYSISGANPSETTFNMPLASSDTAHLRAVINIPSTHTNSSDVLVGVWTGTTNTTAGSLANFQGIGVRIGYGNSNITFESALGFTTTYGSVSTGLWYIDISIDTNVVSFLMHDAAHTLEYGVTNTRVSIGAINGFACWNTDTNTVMTNSVGIGPLCIRKSLVSCFGNSLETNDFTAYSVDDANDRIRYQLPPNYNVNVGANIIIQMHGNGYDETTVWTGADGGGPTEVAYYKGLVNAGNILLSTYGYGNNWGSTNGVNAINYAITYAIEHFNIKHIYLIGQSMGFLSCLNSIAQNRVKVNGTLGLFPVCSLINMTNTVFWTYITNYPAYSNILSVGYSTATKGYDPTVIIGGLTTPDRYQSFSNLKPNGVPMRFYASLSDTTVLEVSNALYFSNIVQGYLPENTVVQATGLHGDPSHFQLTNTLNFIQSCESYAIH